MLINAVFEGGGVKGISLAGAVQGAQDCGIQFNRVAGTSSGSIVAALLAAGYRAEEMKVIIENTPFVSLLRRSPIFNTRWIGPAARLFLKKGLYSGRHWNHGFARCWSRKGFAHSLTCRKVSCLLRHPIYPMEPFWCCRTIFDGSALILPSWMLQKRYV